MRQFGQPHFDPARFHNDAIVSEINGFKQFSAAIAMALELPSSLRPEVSLLLELFEAEKRGKRLTVSMLGLLDGIAPTTTLRYLELLENSGAITRIPHEKDNRMRYVELLPEAKKALENAISAVPSTALASCKPNA